MTIVHLATDTVSVVLDARGGRLPTVVHWGAPLGPLSDEDLATLADTVVGPAANSAVDEPVGVALVPEATAGHPGRPGLRGHRAGQAWVSTFRVADLRVDASSVTVVAEDPYALLHLEITVELTPSGVLRLRSGVANDSDEPYTVDGLEAALPVPAHAVELLDLTGHWARERHPNRHRFGLGTWARESRRGRTGHDATLALLAGTEGFGFRHGEVWGLHVAWSGNHLTYAERLPEGGAALGGGELLASGEVILAPGEEYVSPWLYAAYSGRGIDGFSAAFHAHLRSRPGHPGRPRPVVLNTWEAVYFDHDLDRLRRLADVAARVGVERFVLDDGWFRHRRGDHAGLGDWYVDETVWPDGLGPIVEHVRSLGLAFGLWVEPEMINEDSDLYRAHPDWVLAPGDGSLPPRARHQQVLDLNVPQAYAYVLERLDELLSANDIAFLKWDHNRDLVAAGHAGRSGVHGQTLAVYRLIDELRRRHPGVEIESCSSGGARVDLEILERTDRVWASDSNDALERQTIQRWTALLLPPELVGAHVGPATVHSSWRTQHLSFRYATALFGHFGLEWDISALSDHELDALSAGIAYYHQVRDLLHTGELVRADHPDPSAYVHGMVTRERALFAYVQLTTSERSVPAAMRLPGLDPDARYQLTPVAPVGQPLTMGRAGPEWEPRVLTGRALAEVGVRPPLLAPEQAWLVEVNIMTG
ncbi:alpha-galactosidase [Actinophytocola xinjiangensis]|uniref:alpha-galactosidase n=1 Tax=Actinophytocola xinjiangensis TaxID=485602 RepID=A0A7Z1AVA0_9PSEU|nr:alpha-galactosidase [Actinophytocola xinjiangensis]OLF06153.1 alpha-galactosidase [Actinophytocola xinjiangensis]